MMSLDLSSLAAPVLIRTAVPLTDEQLNGVQLAWLVDSIDANVIICTPG